MSTCGWTEPTKHVAFTYSQGVSESLSKEEVRRIVRSDLKEEDAEALAAWYAGFVRGVEAFPSEDLKRVEPPLRSTPGPSVA